MSRPDDPVVSSDPFVKDIIPNVNPDLGFWNLQADEEDIQNYIPFSIAGGRNGVGDEEKIKRFVENMRKQVDGTEPVKLVVGLDELQQTIIDAIVAPQEFKIHSDLTIQAILLAGPPGCAKTTVLLHSIILSARRLGKPISYFKMLYSDALSSFVGESEKIIKFLFESAQNHQPSVILIDEVDGLMRKRKQEESDSTSRFKSALLTQMQGYSNNPGVVIIATTNLPDTMDEGFQRRFQERLMVRLPSHQDRVLIFDHFVGLCQETGPVNWDSFDFKKLAEHTKRFSGDDIRNTVAKALRRKLIEKGHTSDLEVATRFEMKDVTYILKKSKPTCKPEDIRKLEKWGKKMATNNSNSNAGNTSSNYKIIKAIRCIIMGCICGTPCGAR